MAALRPSDFGDVFKGLIFHWSWYATLIIYTIRFQTSEGKLQLNYKLVNNKCKSRQKCGPKYDRINPFVQYNLAICVVELQDRVAGGIHELVARLALERVFHR